MSSHTIDQRDEGTWNDQHEDNNDGTHTKTETKRLRIVNIQNLCTISKIEDKKSTISIYHFQYFADKDKELRAIS